MKKYDYSGNLKEDIKSIGKKFNYENFFLKLLCHIIALLVTFGLLSLVKIPINIGPFICFSIFIIRDIVEIIIECKDKSNKAIYRLEKLYNNINLNFTDRALSMVKLKESIVLQKREKVIEDMDTSNPVMSKEEHPVNYFYLLDTKDKIQVLRQIKYDTSVYLLEEEDIKRENIEIPNEKVKKLK